jgi:GntR family transcriptional regulator/MocR family aminotransferase
MFIRLNGPGPLYQQLYRTLREAILSGRVGCGGKLPSTRALAEELGISRNVVLIAYEQLESEGYVSGRGGSGTYASAILPEGMIEAARLNVASAPRTIRTQTAQISSYGRRVWKKGAREVPTSAKRVRPLRYDFQYWAGAEDDFPNGIWKRLVGRALRSPALDYGQQEGQEELRVAIAEHLQRFRAVRCTPEQLLVVNGSQQALDLTARVLIDAGDSIVMEDPSYKGARDIFLAAGAKVIPIPVDRDGLQVSRLPRQGCRARLAYITPSHQFPTGAILSLDRRLELLDWAYRNNTYIVEDDFDADYRYDGRPIESVQGLDRTGRVIYVGTFSRILSPAVRVGYMVLPHALVRPVAEAKWLTDRHTPTLQQKVLNDFIREGHLDRCLRRSRTRNARRRAALLTALKECFGNSIEVTGAHSGVHLFVRFPGMHGQRLLRMIERAARAGVGVYSAKPYYLRPNKRSELLLGYASLNTGDIREGVRILSQAT